MSAAQPKPTETKPSEPSMEEILASIRRIISDDQATRPAAKAAPEPPAPPAPEARQPDPPPPAPEPVKQEEEEEEEILELAPKVQRDENGRREPEPHFITDDPVEGDVSFDDTPTAAAEAAIDAHLSMAAEPAPEPPAPQPVMPPLSMAPPMPELPEPDNDRLLSPTTGRVVSSAFNNLANTVLSNNARTLDDLVHEMLRPLIKSWLDENLPTVVERLVRAEIERVARGGR